MRKTPSNAELDLLVGLTMGALPDSFSQRKAVLVTLLFLLPRGYAGRDAVCEALRGLRIHEQAQARFVFSGQPTAASGQHNGGGK